MMRRWENAVRLTKWTHACVQVDVEGVGLLIDPGTFTPHRAELLNTATTVLITHEHFDHVDIEAVTTAAQRRGDLRVIAPHGVHDALIAAGTPATQVTAVDGDEVLDIDGVEVRCVGGPHASIHQGIPVPFNVGYLIGGEVFHPGDSFSVPPFAVRTLLVPISGPWVKIGEAMDFIQAVAPAQTVAVHEVMLSEIGQSSAERFLGADGLTGTPMRMLAPGQSIEL